MNDEQRRNHDRLTRVRGFCEALTPPFTPDSRGGQALAAITEAIAEAEELDAAQLTHNRTAQQGTSQRREARKQLRDQLNAIVTTTRSIGLDHPEVRDKFRASISKLNDTNLLSTARSFHAEATTHKALFLEYAMPADFLETLDASINNFEQAIGQQNTGAGGGSQARRGIDEAHERAELALEKMDAIVRNRYRSDAATLAAWESASHLERPPRSNRTNAAPTPQENP